MAGGQVLSRRGGWFAAALAVSLLTNPGPARAQAPSPPFPPAGTPAPGADEIANDVTTPEEMPAPMAVPGPAYYPAYGAAPTAPRVELGVFDTITESIFGQPDQDTWRPLPLSTLFSEGWNEAWVPSPRGSGGAPRQGWINAMDGNLFRLWFFTFAQGFNRAPTGNGYLGSYTLKAPLSRRLEVIFNIPFYLRNNAVTGLPIINPNRPAVTASQSHSGFGDISITPRALLHETKDFSHTAEVAVLTPTGTEPLAGKAAVTPAFGLWNNFADGWVIRGGLGVLVPTQGGGGSTLINQLAIGQTLTPHDLPCLGDFTYFLSTVVNTPLNDGDKTSVTLTPGIRTHLGNDRYFLAGLPTPVTKDRVAEIGMIFWFMKAW